MSRPPFDRLNLATHVGDDPTQVRQNRTVLIEAIGGAQAGLQVIGAAHSANVASIHSPGDAVVEGVDALVTDIPDLALLGLGADCAVVTFVDTKAGVVGVAHCGWQGLVKGILAATVTQMADQGATPGSIQAHVGPSICGQCYEVDPERAAQVATVAPTAVFDVRGRYGVDIALGAASQLAELGVVATGTGECTSESSRHFSYRRDGKTGRQGAAVVLRRPAA